MIRNDTINVCSDFFHINFLFLIRLARKAFHLLTGKAESVVCGSLEAERVESFSQRM